MNLKDLFRPFSHNDLPNLVINGIQNDSRWVKPGDLFVAYPGYAVDGRQFIPAAIAKGAIAIAYEALNANFKPDVLNVPCIAIPQLSQHLGVIAARFYDAPSQKLSVTGITGTNGKTTIAYQLAQAHGYLGQEASYIGTLGEGRVDCLHDLGMTTPDALLLQKLFASYFTKGITQVCMEVSSHALDQHRVAEVAFDHAIYTNLSHDHLDYHQTMDAYAKAKALLFASPSLTAAILNGDDPYMTIMKNAVRQKDNILTYGMSKANDISVLNWQSTVSGSEIEVSTIWGKLNIATPLPGEFNVYNTLAIFTSLCAHGYSISEVIAVIKKLKPSPGRMEVVAKAPYVVVDYAHTPDALEKALKALSQLKKSKLKVVFGCGGDRDKTKRPKMGYIASRYADEVFITSDNPRTESPMVIIEEIAQGITDHKCIQKIVDRKMAIQQAIHSANTNDIILIAGKGHEAYQQIGSEKIPFSDQDIAKALLMINE